MKTEEIKKIIKEYILKDFLPGEDPDNLNDSTPLISGAIIDSVGILMMTSFLEERFNVKVEAHELIEENLFCTIELQ